MRILLLPFMIFLIASCGQPRAPIAASGGAMDPLATTSETLRGKALILDYGFDALSARVRLLRSASRTIDMQYYIWHPDHSGQLLMREVLDAADRGVQIRILVDGLGAKDCLRHMRKLRVHDNITIGVFNNLGAGVAKAGNILRINTLQRRMHNKLMVVDDCVLLTGGRNIGDEYFWTDGDMAFLDMDVLASGPVVAEAAASFDTYWNSPRVKDLEKIYSPMGERQLLNIRRHLATLDAPVPMAERINAALDHNALSKPASPNAGPYEGEMRFFADDPEKTDPGLSDVERDNLLMTRPLKQYLTRKHVVLKHIDIANAYFIPGTDGVANLLGYVESGATVRVLTNSLMATDVPMVHAAYAGSRLPLLQGGVELWELRAFAIKGGDRTYHDNLALHTKMMLINDTTSVIGSANLDPRSKLLNCELALTIDNAECTAALRRTMDQICHPSLSFKLTADSQSGCGIRWSWSNGEAQELSSTREPHRNLWRGFLQNFYHMVVPSSML